LKQSERHLRGIRSVFGGIKNYLFAKNSGLPPAKNHQASTSQNMPHSKSSSSSRIPTSTGSYQPENDKLNTITEQNHPSLKSRGLVKDMEKSTSIDEILDRNLNEMAMGLSRLKGLALDMNSELDEHDDIKTRLDDKVNRTVGKVEKQTKIMSKILKKWIYWSQ